MCGITFFVVSDGQGEEVKKHLERGLLKHRGPDASAVVVKDTFAMGFDRLAIVNLSDEGMQPFSLGKHIMVASGEIWNYRELFHDDLRSDMDVIMRLFHSDSSWDSEEIKRNVGKLDGDFAFVIADDCDGAFVAARDHIGVRPLFYGTDEEGKVIAFASEAKGLVGGPGITGVHVFPPGHFYSSREGVFVAYTACFYEGADCLGGASVRGLLESAIKKRIEHSERPVGLLCSGGVDSSVIVAVAEAMPAGRDLHVFTVEYADGHSDDAIYARLLCEKLGLQHTMVRFTAADVRATIEPVIKACETYDPNTIRAAIPMYLLAKHIAEKTDIKVILGGEGSDECFGGYNYFQYSPSDDAVNDETARLLRNIHMFDLLRADRCFAAHGLEVRAPFLDQSLVAFVGGLPGEKKVGDKELLRDAFKHLTTLGNLRILERLKERLSDGCGFSYVPALLNSLSPPDTGKLADKLKYEATYYRGIFDGIYGEANSHWIIQRELPDWPALREIEGRAGQSLID